MFLAAIMVGWPVLMGSGAAPSPVFPTTLDARQATFVTPPDAPTGLSATPGNGEVTLSWIAPASDGGLPVVKYRVYDSTTSGFTPGTPVESPVGTSTSATVTSLANGTTYYFLVIAVNDADDNGGASPASNQASATPAAPPDAPTGLSATAHNGEVTLSWTTPASDGGAPVTSYRVYDSTTSGFTPGSPVESPAGTTATVTGLANGTTYYFVITAVNQAGPGPASDQISAIPAGPPGAPTGLSATAENGEVTLSWTTPASDDGAPVTSYRVYDSTTVGFTPGTPAESSTGTSATVTGLANGTTYYFLVTAVNQAGQSPASNQTSATPATSAAPPGAPTGLSATAHNGGVTLSWAAPALDGGAPVTSYDIYDSTSAGFTPGTPAETSAGTGATVTGLANGTTYYFLVNAVNDAGASPASNQASARPDKTRAKQASPRPSERNLKPAPGSVPKPLIALLATTGTVAVAGALTLATRGRRLNARSPRHVTPGSQVRAEPGPRPRPDAVNIRETGTEPTHTIRFEPDHGTTTTTIKEKP